MTERRERRVRPAEGDLTAEVRFTNGYRMVVGPARPDGRREVRVHDDAGRASGHTAVESVAELKALASSVRRRTPIAGARMVGEPPRDS